MHKNQHKNIFKMCFQLAYFRNVRVNVKFFTSSIYILSNEFDTSGTNNVIAAEHERTLKG